MSNEWPKVINDPVHDLILFEKTDCDRLLLKLINTKEFQRLRRIKQLGMSELVFPGASHSRFAHSIGVMQMARYMLVRLQKLDPTCVDTQSQIVVLAAALLHDLGHGPFSHTFEKITGEDHEARTEQVVLDESTEVNRYLREMDGSLPQMLIDFFGHSRNTPRQSSIPTFLTHIVSSQLDADRFDYLLRDSYATKTQYGIFEYKWLIEHLHVDTENSRFYLSGKALQAAEGYVFARYHMYRAVYFHKATRSAEVMLRLLFLRLKHLLSSLPANRKKLLLSCMSSSVVKALRGAMSLQDYLALDDYAISELMKSCEASGDPVLARLGAGLLHRRLYKGIDVTAWGSDRFSAFRRAAEETLEGHGIDPKYGFANDTPADTPYKPYDPFDPSPAPQIQIEDSEGKIKELSHISPTVEQLRHRYNLERWYYPGEYRQEIKHLAKAR